MIHALVIVLAALFVIAGSAVLGPKVGLASPLVLVAVGVAASFLPVFDDFEIDPEWILQGVLPPLLYSSAVSMPAMNFRREMRTISGLAVALVVASALIMGVFFMVFIPDVGFAWGVALGAVISPTDAVATSIIKRTRVSKRVVAMLEGESLLNDATALVLLRTAIVATVGAFSFWSAVGTFAYSVAVAVVIGFLVGRVNLWVRARLDDPTVSTVISFIVPFLASVPAEALGASGLVAAVVAGLITGFGGPRVLNPASRLAQLQNWRTVELILEGGVFLTMGLQLKTILDTVEEQHAGIAAAVLVAFGALVLTIVVRAAYVMPLLWQLDRRSKRYAATQGKLQDFQAQLATDEGREKAMAKMAARRPNSRNPDADLDRFSTRITRGLANIDYFLKEPLGWRDGIAVVWAGMRGAVTVAAVQTLPEETPQRAVLILIAYTVAALSLALQGGTIGILLKAIAPQSDTDDSAQERAEERNRLYQLLRDASAAIPEPEIADDAPRNEQFEVRRQHRMAVLAAQREALLDARDDGTYDAEILEDALANLDADQIAIDLRERLVE